MVSPILILRGLPESTFENAFFNSFSFFKHPKKYSVLTWIIASVVMWGGHFLNAARGAAESGIAISGISVSKHSWLAALPSFPFYLIFFAAGFVFALPVFNPKKDKRLHPVVSVIYLFTACVSCSVLGLYVTFMASSAAALDSITLFSDPNHFITITPKTDQEIAGLLMWVPGCILYVVSSMQLLLPWYDSKFPENKKVLKPHQN